LYFGLLIGSLLSSSSKNVYKINDFIEAEPIKMNERKNRCCSGEMSNAKNINAGINPALKI